MPNMTEPDGRLDCAGLYCPIPIVKTKLQLERMKPGQILEVISDDPGSKKDFQAWCGETGNELLNIKEEEGVFIFHIRKK